MEYSSLPTVQISSSSMASNISRHPEDMTDRSMVAKSRSASAAGLVRLKAKRISILQVSGDYVSQTNLIVR